jgi:SET domain-containing protein
MLSPKYKSQKQFLKVKKSYAGLGLFANAPFKRGQFLIEYVGPILTCKEADERGGRYLFETNKNRFIDGKSRSNIARYINHSCKPNCEVDIRRGHILVFAKNKIEPGEELTYDYGKEYFDEYIKPVGCKCGNH